MRLCWEEPFGPVVPIVRVSTEDDALRYVNESKYGLQGCVFTRDIDRAIRVADRMETGTVSLFLLSVWAIGMTSCFFTGANQRPAGSRSGPLSFPGGQGQRDREPRDRQLDRDDDQGEEHGDQPRQALLRHGVISYGQTGGETPETPDMKKNYSGGPATFGSLDRGCARACVNKKYHNRPMYTLVTNPTTA